MRSRPMCLGAVVLALAVTGPARAAVHLTTAVTFDTPDDVGGFSSEMWVSGGRVRMENKAGEAGTLPAGSFVLLLGKRTYIVHPATRTYTTYINSEPQSIGAFFRYREPKLEKLADEDGGKILGYDTRHLRVRLTYRVRDNGTWDSRDSLEKEIWATSQIPDDGLMEWLSAGENPMGSPELGKILDQLRSTIKGFPLKAAVTTRTERTVSGQPEKLSTTTRITMEVTTIETIAVDEARFALPAGYSHQVPPTPPR